MRPQWAGTCMVHHQNTTNPVIGGVRNRGASVNLNPVFMLLAMRGCRYRSLAVSIIHHSWQFFNHNALTPKLGWLERITPSHHRVHHLNQKQYADTNYGGTFLLWDKLSVRIVPDGIRRRLRRKNSRFVPVNPMRESNLPFYVNGLLLIWQS